LTTDLDGAIVVDTMRGGVLVCFRRGDRPGASLERAIACMRWHTGRPVEHVDGPLTAFLLVDDDHGPFVERVQGTTVITHGCPARSVRELENATHRFAALEWDGRLLRAIRDPLGETPLFYRCAFDSVWFSTEIPPLVALAPATPDLAAITATATGYPYARRTGWEGVLRVLPGEVVEVDQDLTTTARRYWLPMRRVGSFRGDQAQAIAEFRHRFETAVDRCMGRTTGILLSGGLDSSSVAVVASRLRAGGCSRLAGVGYPSVPQVDEAIYARAVAFQSGLPLTWLRGSLDPWDPRTDVGVLGAPGVLPPVGALDIAIPALADQGCDVILDGHDGDGVLGFRYATLANTLLDRRLHTLGTVMERSGRRATLRTLTSEFLPPALRMRRLRGRRTVRQELADHLSYFRGQVRERCLREFRWRPPRSGWRRLQVRKLLPPLLVAIEELESVGARFGVDIRHPFADRELVEFMVSLPHAIKASPMISKPVLRAALTDLLPAVVRDRRDKPAYQPVLDRRVDYGACLDVIRESGVRLPDVDYHRLFTEEDPSRVGLTWVRLAQAHLFASGAAA
jgi:asparagine synthase (glutamine-hydrolysing)